MDAAVAVRSLFIGVGSLLVLASLDLGFPFRRGAMSEHYSGAALIFGGGLLLLVLLRSDDEERRCDDDVVRRNGVHTNNHINTSDRAKRNIGWVLLSGKSFSGKGLATDEEQARRRMQRLANQQLQSQLAANQLSQLQNDLLANAPEYFAECDCIVYAGTRNGVLRSALAKCVDVKRLDKIRLE